ncbi:MAG: hypothetical protein UX89_C0003G0019 [Parcubacteria group bacterium GW2011_GWA2_47_16]|nr:MAG: hypothetical protein UX89_C0003G0019 [Parcubacteria group bacterium GW2011_GWA2_47_16]
MTEVMPQYILKRSARSRHVRVSVRAGGLITVSAPRYTPESFIKSFLLRHNDWLKKKVQYFKKFPEEKLSLAQEKKLFTLHKARAWAIADAKVDHWNRHFKFPFNKISIRNSRSRWGSCSSKGTLCFNYKIVFLPEHLSDYLVVHELCHLKERNHGRGFWSLVALVVPDYALRRKELRNFQPKIQLYEHTKGDGYTK